MPKSIVLLRPPMLVLKWAHVSSKCPPLGLAYVASALEQAGYPVRAVDALGEAPFQCTPLDDPNFLVYGLSIPEIVKAVGDADVLGVSLMFSHDWPIAKAMISAVKEANPKMTVICGGEHVTAAPEFCLKDCPAIDFCVLGEGEETIVDLMRALDGEKAISQVTGIVYRDTNGVHTSPRRGRITALGDISWPAWKFFPLENYLGNGLGYGVNPGRTLPILASRGCPYSCTFCSNPLMWTTKWQARPVDDVIREMQYGIDWYGAQNFDFYDLTTVVKKDWIVEFCKRIIAKGWDITWQMPSGTRSEALDAEVLALMYKAGVKNISYAPESGSPTTLEAVKKRISLDRMKESMRAALREGMNVKLNMIMGFPHESRKEIRETLSFLKDMALMGVHDIYISCFSPYPGSELFEQIYGNEKTWELDDRYFYNLTSYGNIRYSESFSPHFSDRELTFYRVGGMVMFYGLSYLVRPWRFIRTFYNLAAGKEESRLEMSLAQLKGRLLGKKVSRGMFPEILPEKSPTPGVGLRTSSSRVDPRSAAVDLG